MINQRIGDIDEDCRETRYREGEEIESSFSLGVFCLEASESKLLRRHRQRSLSAIMVRIHCSFFWLRAFSPWFCVAVKNKLFYGFLFLPALLLMLPRTQ
jgi:hypothetical protein